MEKMNEFFISQSRKECFELIKKYLDDSVSIIALTGESGVGKSNFVKYIDRFVSDAEVLIVDQFCENTEHLLRIILKKLGNNEVMNKKEMLQSIAQYGADLLADGKKLLIVLDDISGITEDIASELPRLFDYEYDGKKVLTLMIITNNQDYSIYRDWATTYFKFINQAIAYLNPFTKNETIQYFRYICEKNDLDLSEFNDEDFLTVYKYTEGIPDRISKIAELLKSFGIKGKISVKDVHSIVKSTNIIREQKSKKIKVNPSVIGVLILFLLLGAVVVYLSGREAKKVEEIKVVAENKSVQDNSARPIMDNATQHVEIKKKEENEIEKKIETKTAEQSNKKSRCFVLKANLKLRSNADMNAEYLMVIPRGTLMEEIEKKGDWIKVKYKGKTGWIKGEAKFIRESECKR